MTGRYERSWRENWNYPGLLEDSELSRDLKDFPMTDETSAESWEDPGSGSDGYFLGQGFPSALSIEGLSQEEMEELAEIVARDLERNEEKLEMGPPKPIPYKATRTKKSKPYSKKSSPKKPKPFPRKAPSAKKPKPSPAKTPTAKKPKPSPGKAPTAKKPKSSPRKTPKKSKSKKPSYVRRRGEGTEAETARHLARLERAEAIRDTYLESLDLAARSLIQPSDNRMGNKEVKYWLQQRREGKV